MQLVTFDISSRFASPEDAFLVHQLYSETPHYFDIISIPMPTLGEVHQELDLVRHDNRRHAELLLSRAVGDIPDPKSGQNVVGYLDYKLAYPQTGDAMVNLLLISGKLQSRGLASRPSSTQPPKSCNTNDL